MQPRSFFRMSGGSKWFCNCIHILSVVLFLSAIGNPPAQGCWGTTSPKYGFTTEDYSLLVGSVLVIDCTLNSGKITVNNVEYKVNSSNLVFKKDDRYLTDHVHLVNSSTAQLRIPNASARASGHYYCSVSIPEEAAQVVCSTLVHVGYKPKPVRDFRCISMFFENLTCTWNFTKSGIATNYTLYRHYKVYEQQSPTLQLCPPNTSNSTFCQWRGDTDPPYDKSPRTLSFTIQAKNNLGFDEFNFTLNHYEIVLPDHPRLLSVWEATEQSITVRWSPPRNFENGVIPLQYQLRIEDEKSPPEEVKVFDVGLNVFNYTVLGLIPYTSYTISVRCRSNYTSRDDMWSSFASTKKRTLPDVPYKIPETIPEAFEILHYEGFRGVSLYWKPISPKFYNGENFTYHVKCFQDGANFEDVPCKEPAINRTVPSATFNHLQESTSYSFRLYSLNSRGPSHNYTVIIVDQKENVLFPPEDVTVISNDLGHYDISWKPPRRTWEEDEEMKFVVFWCSSLKPSVWRCEGPIQWLRTPELNTTLRLPDRDTNFQFAVATTSAKGSSGMRWASCIVPYKAALSKIESLDVGQLNSTSLKVLWRLNCAAQKAVVEKFEIIYCKVNEKLQCQGKKESVFVPDPEADSYILTDLHPFTDYSVVIRAYKDGLPSENSDPKIATTAEGAPSDPPREVKAEVKPDGIVVVTWHQPRELNGHVTHYSLYINGQRQLIDAGSNGQEVYSHEISGLRHYSTYTIELQACHGHECSPVSRSLTVQTDVGVPGNMDPPRIEVINSTFVEVSWNSPLEPNGPIDFYEVQWKVQDEDNSTAEDTVKTKNVTNGETTEVELNCESVEDGGITYLFSVRAANRKNNVTLYGSLSTPTKARGCFMTQELAMIIGIAIGGTLALAFAALLLFKLIKWMREKIDQLKSITIKLPKGLDGPESNQLNNYYNFKNGLSHPKSPSKGVETLSYAIGDAENKNRHGSGSSQYSNVSTDELLYRNGKCTKFGRKPSGESSGCSSMSSNTINAVRTPLSSDSGAESDFHTPPSPDMMFGDHKCPLPIVMESQDSSLQDTDPGLQTDQLTNANNNKNNPHLQSVTLNSNLPNGMIVKIDQPYSKFGITRNVHTVPPWWMNPLAFYSCNLSNSEPSVFALEQSSEQAMKAVPITLSPYSKVRLARSSGDILRIPSTEQGLGYSKFGIIRNVERSQSNSYTRRNDPSVFPHDLLSPTVGVAVVNVKPVSSELRLPKKGVNGADNFSDRDAIPSDVPQKANRNYLDPRNLSPYISFKQFTQKNGFIQPRDEEAVYTNTKSEHQMPAPHTGPPDYVSLNEVQGLVYTPKKSPLLPSSDKVSSLVPESENAYNAESGIFSDEALNEVGLDEINSLFQDTKFGHADSQNERVAEISPSPRSDHAPSPSAGPESHRSEVHPHIGSSVFEENCNGCPDSENNEPIAVEESNLLQNGDYLNQPGVVLDLDLVSALNNESVNGISGWDESSDNFGIDSQTKNTDVCLDIDKPNLPLLYPSKTESEKGLVSATQKPKNPNSSPKDLLGDSLPGDAKYVNRTGSYKESDSNSSCSPQSHVGYVPFVSLMSCGNNQRNSAEVSASHETGASESRELTGEPAGSARLRATVNVDQISDVSRPDSSDRFKVPEQNSARNHTTDPKRSLHLHPIGQPEVLSDVICDKTGSPRCTKESISMNGSLNPCFHLVPMVESEICEV